MVRKLREKISMTWLCIGLVLILWMPVLLYWGMFFCGRPVSEADQFFKIFLYLVSFPGIILIFYKSFKFPCEKTLLLACFFTALSWGTSFLFSYFSLTSARSVFLFYATKAIIDLASLSVWYPYKTSKQFGTLSLLVFLARLGVDYFSWGWLHFLSPLFVFLIYVFYVEKLQTLIAYGAKQRSALQKSVDFAFVVRSLFYAICIACFPVLIWFVEAWQLPFFKAWLIAMCMLFTVPVGLLFFFLRLWIAEKKY